uniref:acyl-CoA dehydrogenase C-terminal domain-containing protein n=1 Tax=Burkholderia gladioli TaxID=28095 RepID=UPI00163FFCC6
EVTRIVWSSGDLGLTLANATVYLEAFGHIVAAWIWLEQAWVAQAALPQAVAEDEDFYRGKLAAAGYFFRWELRETGPQLDLLASLDRTTLDMQDTWY